MGMFSFIKEAGEKLFDIDKAEAAEAATPTPPAPSRRRPSAMPQAMPSPPTSTAWA